MMHDGQRVVRCKKYGWRHGNPETDVDEDGQPVDSYYFVLVNIKDCPVKTDEHGRRFYVPDGVPQALKLCYCGTNYGYETTTRTARRPRWVYGVQDQPVWIKTGETYRHVRKFVIKDGYVHSTSYDLPTLEVHREMQQVHSVDA